MIRTQVQLPNELHERAKRFAEEREMSLAEVVRRSLELLLDRYPAVTPGPDWVLPTFNGGGIKVPLEDLRYYSRDEEAYRSLGLDPEDDEAYLALVRAAKDEDERAAS